MPKAADKACPELAEGSVRPTQSALALCLPLLARGAKQGAPSFLVVLRKAKSFCALFFKVAARRSKLRLYPGFRKER
jgi:hypothetical protein